jgi:tetratricopeptide (TPR) repeat protein
MKLSGLQISLIVIGLLLSVGIYYAPSQINRKSKPAKEAQQQAGDFDEEGLLESAKKSLDSEQLSSLGLVESALKKQGSQDTSVLDQMGRFWDRQGIPAAAALWFEKKAIALKTERSYLDAAFRYFDAFKLAGDSSLKDVLVQKAITNYQEVIKLNPENLDAKTDLGACYAEGTAEPMKGITLLREVVAKNPEHEMAQYNLGMLSVKSGQVDKAIERFTKVLSINPQRSEMHFFLGQIYASKGETAKAITEYELFRTSTSDPEAAKEVKKIIEGLKKGRS